VFEVNDAAQRTAEGKTRVLPPAQPDTSIAVRDDVVVTPPFTEKLQARLARMPAPTESQRVLDDSFKKLLTRWEVDEDHKALVKLASLQGDLGFVGTRYRAVLDVAPDDTRAKKAQNDILALAMSQMAAVQGTANAEPARGKGAILIAAVLFFVVAIGWFSTQAMKGLFQPPAGPGLESGGDP
jgi:hypothetical protein